MAPTLKFCIELITRFLQHVISTSKYHKMQIAQGGKVCGFHRSIGKHETFTVKQFYFDNRVI